MKGSVFFFRSGESFLYRDALTSGNASKGVAQSKEGALTGALERRAENESLRRGEDPFEV